MAVDIEDMGLVEEAVQNRRRGHLVAGKDLDPVLDQAGGKVYAPAVAVPGAPLPG